MEEFINARKVDEQTLNLINSLLNTRLAIVEFAKLPDNDTVRKLEKCIVYSEQEFEKLKLHLLSMIKEVVTEQDSDEGIEINVEPQDIGITI